MDYLNHLNNLNQPARKNRLIYIRMDRAGETRTRTGRHLLRARVRIKIIIRRRTKIIIRRHEYDRLIMSVRALVGSGLPEKKNEKEEGTPCGNPSSIFKVSSQELYL